MALKVFDGYDHYSNLGGTANTDFFARSGFLQYTNWFSSSVGFVTGRNGKGQAVNSLGFTAVFGQRVASAFIGCAYNLVRGQIGVNFNNGHFEFNDTLTGKCQVAVILNQANGSIQVYRGLPSSPDFGPLIASTGNNQFLAGQWQFVEIWPVIDNTTGSIQVVIDNVTVLNVTGLNTKATANASWDAVTFHGDGLGFIMDDLYYADSVAGPGTFPCNTPIGDSRTATLFAVGNNAVQFTPLANSNYQEIQEVNMDRDVSYNSSATVGQEDTFNFGALDTVLTTVLGLQLTVATRKDDAAVRSLQTALISGATEVYGATDALPSGFYAYFTDLWVLDPNTGLTWTRTAVNAIKAGYKLAA